MLKMTRQEYQSRDYEFDEIEDDPRLVRAKKRNDHHVYFLFHLRGHHALCLLLLCCQRYG